MNSSVHSGKNEGPPSCVGARGPRKESEAGGLDSHRQNEFILALGFIRFVGESRPSRMIDRKGIFSFLLITFAVTYLLERILILSSFRVTQIPAAGGHFVVMIAMWVPAVATPITIRFVTHEEVSSTRLRFGPSWKPYIVSALIIPLSFILIYLLT